jgi:hypothetical protein
MLLYEPFHRREKHLEFCSELCIKRKGKPLETCSKPFKDKEKHMDDFLKTFFRGIAFHSEPRNGLFETHGIPRKEHFIPRNNANQSGILMTTLLGTFP